MDQTLRRIFKLILIVIVVGFFIWFLFEIRSTVTLIIISLLLAYILDPIASYFEYRGLSRMQSTVIIFLCIATVFVGVFYFLIPPPGERIVQYSGIN